ncbi:hypothetical protein YC2023_011230 [Brassica napus]
MPVVRAVSMGVLPFTRSNSTKHVIMLYLNQFYPSQKRARCKKLKIWGDYMCNIRIWKLISSVIE